MAKKELLALVAEQKILNRIYFLRGQKIMLDADLAEMYKVETRRLNEQVKRNASRFPEQFLTIAFGSLAETEILLDFCYRLKYIESENYARLEEMRKEVCSLLRNFYPNTIEPGAMPQAAMKGNN